MNIAFVTFHEIASNTSNIGGIATTPIYMKAGLESVGENNLKVDIISLAKIKRKDEETKYPDAIYLGYFDKRPQYIVDYLNKYDFIIFNTPGYSYESKKLASMESRYSNLINNLITPYTFVINDENDPLIYPHTSEFVNAASDHSYYAGPFFNSPDMEKDFPLLLSSDGKYANFNYFPPINSLGSILIQASDKITQPRTIGSTSRWTPRKRIVELIQTSNLYHQYDLDVLIYGGSSNYFYTQKMKSSGEGKEDYYKLMGNYNLSDLDEIMSSLTFHYNFVYLKRIRQGRVMRPRLELASVEAFNHGVLPVICSDTTPEWCMNGMVRVPGVDQDKIPEILSNISNDEIIERLKDIHYHITDQYNRSYNGLYNFIMNYQED